jgi:hypothetical protein
MKKVQKAGVIGISSALLLTGALPAAASVPQTLNTESTSTSSTQSASGSASAPGVMPESPASVLADTKIKRDEAVELAKKYVQAPEGYVVDNVSLQNNINGSGAVWSINYSKQKDGQYYGGVSVGIHAETGSLVRFNSYASDPDVKPVYPPKTSLAEAKPVAEAFIKNLYPAELAEARYNTSVEENFKTPLNGDVRYTFRYDRLVNGVVYPSNGFNVEVNGNGDVVGFSYSWDTKSKFEDAGTVITQEKALEIWKKESKLSTTYFKPYDRINKDSTFSVAHYLKAVQLNAVTGELFDKSEGSVTGTAPVTAAPAGAEPKSGQSLTKSQAVDLVASLFAIPADAALESANYNEYSNHESKELRSTWDISWRLADNTEKDTQKDAAAKTVLPYPGSGSIYASVNASTGEIVHFNINNNRIFSSSPADLKDYKVTLEDAKTKAVDTVKKLVPHLTHQLVINYSDPTQLPETQRRSNPAYTFTFSRVIDGINANNESVSVIVDGVTGDITSYYNSLSQAAYPLSKPALIDASKALELWAGQYSLELQYVDDWKAGIASSTISVEKYMLMVAAGEIPYSEGGEKSVRLAYVPVAKNPNVINSLYLDAVTGEWKNNRTGEKVSFEKKAAADLGGHWAARELQLMVEYNALDLIEGKVNPDQAATRGELIKMLIIAMNGGYQPKMYDSTRNASFKDVGASNAYFSYVENAVDMNLIDRDPLGNFNPDKIMTRDEMAELIVRALGYNTLAQRSSLFQLHVTDAADIVHKGHAAMVLDLGIMSAQDSKFRPQEEVSRAQAAVAFFRYLEQRSSVSGGRTFY